MSAKKRPVLVTGPHRSGTTWVGRMLSIDKSVAYVHEPFNPNWPPLNVGGAFDHWFTYICEHNESACLSELETCLSQTAEICPGFYSEEDWIT